MSNTPTADHMARAFDLLRRPDWPADLHTLLLFAQQAALVRGLAQRIANGQHIAPVVRDMAPPPARTWEQPHRLAGARPSPRTAPAATFDCKRAAAGEREDD